MGQNPKPVGARINFGHPLARRLRFMLAFNENGSSIQRNLVDPGEYFTIGRNATTWDATTVGRGLNFNKNDADKSAMNKTMNLGATKVTVAALLDNPAALTATAVIFESSINTNDNDGSLNFYCDNSDNSIWLNAQLASQTWNTKIGNLAGMHLYTFTLGPSAPVTGYRDGIQVGTPSASPDAGASFSSQTPYFGGRGDTNAFPMESTVAGFWMWNRVLSPDEIQDHAANPFGMLALPVRQRMAPFAAVAAGGADITKTVGNTPDVALDVGTFTYSLSGLAITKSIPSTPNITVGIDAPTISLVAYVPSNATGANQMGIGVGIGL